MRSGGGQAGREAGWGGWLDFYGGAAIIQPMPIYEYQCKGCGRDFEALVRSSTRVECPHCQSTTLEKKLSAFSTPTSASTGVSSCGAPVAPGAGGGCGACGMPGNACAFH